MTKKENWGQLESGEPIYLYTLRNVHGVEVRITNYGGRLVNFFAPDRQGESGDIVLGFDSLAGYLGKNPYFGALVGRYANRIAGGGFKLNGNSYELVRNNGENSLHGGVRGFDKVVWDAKEAGSPTEPAVELSYLSPDGEEGYPGNLHVTVRYTLTAHNQLAIDYEAVTDRDTVLNLTNHSYFDLSRHAAGHILELEVMLNADSFTPVNEHLIPTGEMTPVEGTPFDFREAKAIGSRINQPNEQLRLGWGYDHNYVINGQNGDLRLAARAHDPKTGRRLEVLTTQPGVQFYSGNHLDGSVTGKGGRVYGFRSGVCFETQHFPDSPNHPSFPSTELKPGQQFRATTIYRVSAV